MYIDINLYMNIYKWVFAQVISMSAPCDFNRKKLNATEDSLKKKSLYICFTILCFINILHLFKEAYFCFWADRAVFTLGQDIVQYVYVFLFICI